MLQCDDICKRGNRAQSGLGQCEYRPVGGLGSRVHPSFGTVWNNVPGVSAPLCQGEHGILQQKLVQQIKLFGIFFFLLEW